MEGKKINSGNKLHLLEFQIKSGKYSIFSNKSETVGDFVVTVMIFML